jgi:hypothetical protein
MMRLTGVAGFRAEGAEARSDNGFIRFNRHRINGCCGADVIHGVYFNTGNGRATTRESLYEEWIDVLINSRDISNVNKIFLTDKVRTAAEMRDYPSIYECMRDFGGDAVGVGEEVFNPSSGNRIATFEVTRNVFNRVRN